MGIHNLASQKYDVPPQDNNRDWQSSSWWQSSRARGPGATVADQRTNVRQVLSFDLNSRLRLDLRTRVSHLQ